MAYVVASVYYKGTALHNKWPNLKSQPTCWSILLLMLTLDNWNDVLEC